VSAKTRMSTRMAGLFHRLSREFRTGLSTAPCSVIHAVRSVVPIRSTATPQLVPRALRIEYPGYPPIVLLDIPLAMHSRSTAQALGSAPLVHRSRTAVDKSVRRPHPARHQNRNNRHMTARSRNCPRCRHTSGVGGAQVSPDASGLQPCGFPDFSTFVTTTTTN
jgi:hypothetical protein